MTRRCAAAWLALAAGLVAGCGVGPDQAPVTAPARAPQPAAQSPGSVARGTRTFIPTCDAAGERAPTVYLLACADANYGVVEVTWQGWGTARAVGVGVAVLNTCVPNCAQGRFERYPVNLVADRPAATEAGWFYRRLVVLPRGGPTPGVPDREVYELRRSSKGVPGGGPVLR